MVREKSVKNGKKSRSGKSVNFELTGKFEILEKVREKSGNLITTLNIFYMMIFTVLKEIDVFKILGMSKVLHKI